jgi:lipopolysaccharide transport system permease protein
MVMIGHMHSEGRRRLLSPVSAPFATAWKHRRLILGLAARELEARYRGSLLGRAWLVLLPLLTVAGFSLVFAGILQVRWTGRDGKEISYFTAMYSGLIFHGFMAETLSRATSIIRENPTYVKKIVFPTEVLVWVTSLVALFNAAVGFLIALLLYFFTVGAPPVTALLIPLAFLPFFLLVLGMGWFLAALGVYLRDIGTLLTFALSMAMMLAPIFYPMSAVPEAYRTMFYLNPITIPLEATRSLLFEGVLPNLTGWAVELILSFIAAWLGYSFFVRTRHGFADVI